MESVRWGGYIKYTQKNLADYKEEKVKLDWKHSEANGLLTTAFE